MKNIALVQRESPSKGRRQLGSLYVLPRIDFASVALEPAVGIERRLPPVRHERLLRGPARLLSKRIDHVEDQQAPIAASCLKRAGILIQPGAVTAPLCRE